MPLCQMRTNTLRVAAERQQKNRELGGQRCSAWAVFGKASLLSALPACLSSFLSWGLNLNCKGNVSSQGTGGEGRLGTSPQPDLAGVHPTSLAPLVARISFPPTPAPPLLASEVFLSCEPVLAALPGQCWCFWVRGRRAGYRVGCSPICSLIHSSIHSFIYSLILSSGITHAMSDPSLPDSVLNSLCLPETGTLYIA